ncbi:MAG: ribosome maturation factor RimP [bacterium]|nr:ribosome maturation factor RimP [bacterium]
MIERRKQQLYELLEEPLQKQACEIADIVLSQYRNSHTVRLFIYVEGGVSLEKCAEVSRLVGDLIDGTELFSSGYTLEVSSPGLDRPLQNIRDYRYRVGETVKLKFADPKRKKTTARILATTGNAVEFEEDDSSFTVDVAEIEQAKIVF